MKTHTPTPQFHFSSHKITSLQDWTQYIKANLAAISLEDTWPERRTHAKATAQEELESMQADATTLEGDQQALMELCFRLSACLFGAGAPDAQWQLWNSMGVAGAISGNHWGAVITYAPMSGEYWAMSQVPDEYRVQCRNAQTGFLNLLFLGRWPEPTQLGAWYDDFWFEVCSGILKSAIRNDVRQLKKYVLMYIQWWEQKMPDWQKHESMLFPDFEPILCSWISLLLEMGFVKAADLSQFDGFLGPALSPKQEMKIKAIDDSGIGE